MVPQAPPAQLLIKNTVREKLHSKVALQRTTKLHRVPETTVQTCGARERPGETIRARFANPPQAVSVHLPRQNAGLHVYIWRLFHLRGTPSGRA